MFFFKKKRTIDKIKEDRELVNYNADTVNVLLELAKNDEELIKELKKLQDDLHFLTPSDLESVLDYDKKIKSALNELKVYITSNEKQKVTAGFSDIKILIAERNRNIK